MLSSRQLREWQLFYEKEPFGDFRGDVQAAIVARTLVALNTRKGKKPPALTAFMPYLEREQESPRERMLRNFRNYNALTSL